MKKITVRELLNMIYEGKAPERIKYNGKVYQNYENADYSDKSRLLSSVMGEHHTLEFMALNKAITIYDEILDDKEKEYLSRIIKPFKMYLISITKEERADREMIIIRYNDYMDRNIDRASILRLPTFKKGTMYNGMQTDKQYTLEELGI